MSNYKEMIKANGPALSMDQDTNNCAVLALSAAFNIPYDQAHKWASIKWNRKNKKGTLSKEILKTFNEDKELFGKSIHPKSNKNKYVYKRTGKVVECSFKIGNFADKMNSGTYYVLVNNHATVVKDGKIMDFTKPGRLVKHVWEIK